MVFLALRPKRGRDALKNAKKMGIIFDIQRYSIHDGPGIRTLVFMKGCPLKCLWCDNPESQNIHNEIMYIEKNCIKCGRCLIACPIGAISAENFKIDREICTNCGKCAETCPANAKKLVGKQVTVDEVLEEVEKDRLFYRNSGGGVTVGGGEPTMQHEFVAGLLKKCQQRNIHTVMETCGYVKWDHMNRILKHLDLVYFDIKHVNPMKHMKLTGVSNRLTLQNVKRVAKCMTPVIIRIPIIPGHNDSEKNIGYTAKFVAGLGSVNEIELLPYHRLGERKYEWLGREYQLKNLQPPTREHVEKLGEIVREYGLDAQVSS